MNQTVFFKKIILFLIVLTSVSDAKLLKPSKDGEDKEILIINGKRRLYYPIDKKGIHYSIQGPTRLEFISRYPVLKKKKKSYPFSYKIIVNESDTVEVNHRYKVQNSIRSIQHPKHKYTFSGNYFINLEKGLHTIELISHKKQKYPILLRVLSKDFGSVGNNKKILKPMIHQEALQLKTNGKSIEYFECSSKYPLQVEASGSKKLRVLTRLQFTDRMGQEESYRLKIREGKKIIGTYYFNSERSAESEIAERLDRVPGKWRSCDIKVPEGKHRYIVEVPDKGKSVLVRFILH